MPAALESPSAPPSGVTIVEAPPVKPPPAPTKTINVSQMPAPVESTPAKRGSAMDRLRTDLQKKAKNQEVQPSEQPTKPPAEKPAEKPTETPEVEPEMPFDAPEEKPTEQPTEKPAEQPTEDAKPKGKTNPWKLVEQYKAKLGEIEKQIADAKTSSLQEKEKTEYLSRIEQLQKRNTELEDEMRYTNYQKSTEFTEKYDKPYQDAWRSAITELNEINVTDQESGVSRVATAQDLLALVNLPLGQAREVAEMVFGKFADDVMAHRKTIRNLFDNQAKALEEAKTKGAQREKERTEMMTKQKQEVSDFVIKSWESANQTLSGDPKFSRFFTPIEGDPEANQRLAKGFEFVDRAFSENPNDPTMTPEQRASAVKRHAALRHRAAAFGRMAYWLEQRDSKIAELENELKQFKESTPPAGGGSPHEPPSNGHQSARDEVFASLRKLAK